MGRAQLVEGAERGDAPEARNPEGSARSWWVLKLADAICCAPSLPLLPVAITVALQADTVSVEAQARVAEQGT